MNAKTIFISLAAAFILLTGQYAGAGETPAPKSTPELKQAIGSGKKTVVFFLNPGGRPCQNQKAILLKLQQDMKDSFNIAYIDANKAEDQKAFYDYGVRGLPSVAVVDGKGNIGKLFPPGIQTYETLMQTLNSTK